MDSGFMSGLAHMASRTSTLACLAVCTRWSIRGGLHAT
jgi:hypothetical protein